MFNTLLASVEKGGLKDADLRDVFKGKSGGQGKVNKKRCKSRFRQLEYARQDFENRWKELRDYQLPFLGYFDDTADKTNAARRRDSNIYNNVAWEACQIFAAGIMSGLTPPNRQWFKLSFQDEELRDNKMLQELLDDRMDKLSYILQKSNFYNSVHSCYFELPFGQAPLAIFEDDEKGVHFVPLTVGSYYIDVSEKGSINTFGMKQEMSAEQIRDRFGEDDLPDNIKDALKDSRGFESRYTVCWLVEPNPDYDPFKLSNSSLPYVSVYWLEGTQDDEFLHVSGFQEWAIPVARYLVTGLEPYAKGPAWFAEGDSKQLSVLEKDYLTAIELGVKPPMQATSDVSLKGINLMPGGANIVESLGNPITPLFQVNVNLEHLRVKIEDLKNSIKRSYSADLFMMMGNLERGSMTAREVIERSQEKMQQLGPVVERLQFEFLSPIIERVYNILERHGVFEPVPEELEDVLDGREVRIEYISPLAQAQKMNGLVNIEQALAFVGQAAQVYPNVVNKIDEFGMIDKYFDLLGAPAAMMKSGEEIEAIMQEMKAKEAEAEQMQQMAAMSQSMAPAAAAAKNLTQAANDGNPALAQLMGM